MDEIQLMNHYHEIGKKDSMLITIKYFKELYPDFDFDFYRNKYFSNTPTTSNYEIMLHYHLEGVHKNYLCNNINNKLLNNERTYIQLIERN